MGGDERDEELVNEITQEWSVEGKRFEWVKISVVRKLK